MTTWIEVTPEAVDAARLHVQAYRSAGMEPDSVVAAMAEAELQGSEPAQASVIEEPGAEVLPSRVMLAERRVREYRAIADRALELAQTGHHMLAGSVERIQDVNAILDALDATDEMDWRGGTNYAREQLIKNSAHRLLNVFKQMQYVQERMAEDLEAMHDRRDQLR